MNGTRIKIIGVQINRPDYRSKAEETFDATMAKLENDGHEIVKIDSYISSDNPTFAFYSIFYTNNIILKTEEKKSSK